MTPSRRISLAFGVLFLVTFITSIPALGLYQPVLDDPVGYIAGAGSDNRIFFAAFLELLLIIANIATAVVPLPILRRENEILAVGYVAARIMECTFILVGILAVLSIVTLRQEIPGGDASALGGIAYTLAALKDWTFILGPGFVVGVGNGLLLGYLMYRSALVPRRLAVFGLIGGPLNCISGVLVMFGVFEQGGAGQSIATIPEIIWEFGLGIYLTVWGFKPSPLTAAFDRDVGAKLVPAPA